MHVSQAGVVLGNHAYPIKLCPMYSIDCIINKKNRKNTHHYIYNIFETKIGGMPDIFTIKTYLFTLLLYWFDDFNATYKSTNMATKRMLSIVRKFRINLQILKEWRKVVRMDSSERFVSNIRNLGDVSQGINDIQVKLVISIEQLRDANIVTKNQR